MSGGTARYLLYRFAPEWPVAKDSQNLGGASRSQEATEGPQTTDSKGEARDTHCWRWATGLRQSASLG